MLANIARARTPHTSVGFTRECLIQFGFCIDAKLSTLLKYNWVEKFLIYSYFIMFIAVTPPIDLGELYTDNEEVLFDKITN